MFFVFLWNSCVTTQMEIFTYFIAISQRTTHSHCMKNARIRSFSGSHFPAFGLNTDTFYAVCVQYQSMSRDCINKSLAMQSSSIVILYFFKSCWLEWNAYLFLYCLVAKRSSENIQQIYRIRPMSKCDFHKVAMQVYWNHTSAWMFSCKFTTYFRTPFTRSTSVWLLLRIKLLKYRFFTHKKMI